MELKRVKPYKARKPEDTIFLIRQILHEKLGLLMKEENFRGEGQFYSCRINIANMSINDLNIGTNGKGMKFEYALASAYGEFMERLQNQILIMNRFIGYEDNIEQFKDSDLYHKLYTRNIVTKYKYAPDEKNIIFDKKQSINCIRKYIKSSNIEEVESFYHGKTLSLVPDVNVFKQSIEYLPINIIFANCTSNGMCAGNTPFEALIQGMCEVMERYVLRLLYYKNLSFPTIPMDNFFGTEIYNKIQLISNKYNWKFEIKDCSCNIGIPAIGILIIDKENMRYKFHLGVDPSPITALERTLTEIYQGRFLLELTDIDWNIQNRLLTDMDLKSHEMFRTCTIGQGHIPITLFNPIPSYNFKGFSSIWGQSDINDMKLLLDVFQQLDVSLYIRDVSFLGFPAFSIYAPGMSEFRNIENDNHLIGIGQLQYLYTKSRNLNNVNKESLKDIIDYIKTNERGIDNLKFYNIHDIWLYYNRDLLLSLFSYSSGNYDDAFRHIKTYISNTNIEKKEKNFFSCISHLIENKINNIDNDLLNSLYPDNLVSSCEKFLENMNYLNFMKHSNCYNCNDCKIKDTCRIADVLTLVKKIENVYINNIPDQNKLKEILKF